MAEEHGQVIGHVALSPVTITNDHGHKAKGWYGLGPISVLPQRQGHGIGSRLMKQALSELRAMQAAGVCCSESRVLRALWLPGPCGCNCRACRPAISWHFHGPVPEGIAQYSDAFNAAA